jgi:hypothetical protein
MEEAVVEMVELGLVERLTIGKRRVLQLGTWEILEKRFQHGTARSVDVFPDEVEEFLDRYSPEQQRVLERAFLAFRSIRKGGKVSPGVIRHQLSAYTRFPASAVIDGLRIYLEGGYAERGFNERYALGIIRGCARNHKALSTEEESGDPSPRTQPYEDRLVRRSKQKRALREELDLKVQELSRQEFGVTDLSELTAEQLSVITIRARQEVGV